jgi:ABC-type multidrug transport system ATPase subunit
METIVVDNLTKSYRNVQALDGVSFSVRVGLPLN